MALDTFLKTKEKTSTPVEAGSHLAVLQSIIHIGIQKNEFDGQVSYKDQVALTFEIQDVETSDGHPVVKTKRETTKTNSEKANLNKLAAAMVGKATTKEGLDLSTLLGKPVMLNFEETRSGGTTIKGYSPVPKGLLSSVKPLIGEAKLLPNVDHISSKELEALPEFMRKIIDQRVKEDTPVDPSVDY